MRYLFIINSTSNPKELQKLENAIAALSDDKRASIELRYTQYAGHATEIASDICDQFNKDITIVACGGDGTVHEIVNGMAYRSTPLIIIPIGTGNDFAHSVYPSHVFSNPTKLVNVLGDIKIAPIDLIRIDSYDVLGNHLPMWSRFCVNTASIGLDTRVMLNVNEKYSKRKNKYTNKEWSYFWHTLLNLRKASYKIDYNLELVDSDINEISENDEFISLSICNGRYYASGYCPSPSALLDDGVLDICAIERRSFWESLKTFIRYKDGLHVGRAGVRTFKATSGIITCRDNSFQLLGNYDGVVFHGHRIRFEVFPEALNVGFLNDN